MNTQTWLARLIQFNTTSHLSNLELLADVDPWLKQHAFNVRLTHDPAEPKANLFATLKSSDGKADGGIVLSGHTDVVPVDGQNWESDPFNALIKDEKIIGRGACDMKGFIAVMLALAPELKQMHLPFPIHFALSYDEEIGCRGAPLMIADLEKIGIKPEACIVGEPTEMRPIIAHKGIQVFRVTITGLAAHSSLTPKGCNAIDYAAKLICYIRELADELKHTGPLDHDFDVPFTSVSTNMIRGGIAQNTIPAHCEFIFEFRHLPAVSPSTIIDKINQFAETNILPAMRREFQSATINIDNIGAAPSFESSNDASVCLLSRELCTGKAGKVAYATEAGLFQNAEIPTIVCGPGSIEQAHRANEFVSLAQLHQCETYLRQFIQQFKSSL